jgi:MFS family permease
VNPYRVLLRNRRLSVFLFGDFASKLGDGMMLVVLPLLALRIRGDLSPAVAVSMALAAPHLLSLPLALWLGLRGARWDPKKVIAIDSTLRFAVMASLAALAAFDILTLWLLAVAMLLGSALRATAAASRRVLATGVVADEERLSVNSILSVNDSSAIYILGPTVGALLVATVDPWLPMVLNAGGFLVLLAALTGLATPPGTVGSRDHHQQSGWKIIRATSLWRLLSVAFGYNLLYGPVAVIIPLFVLNDLGAGEVTYGYLMTTLGVGAVVGALAAGYLRRFPAVGVLSVLLVAWGVALTLFATAQNPYWAGAAIAVCGLVWAPFLPVMYTAVQSRIARHDQQPVLTLWNAGYNIAGPLGVMLGGPYVALLGNRGGMLVAAILTASLAVPAVGAARRMRAT